MSLIIRLIGHKYGLRKEIAYINEELSQCGLPEYRYSPKVFPSDTVLPWINCRRSDIDYLKFIAAKLQENPKWTPDKDFINQKIPFDLKQKFIAENKSHLICHSYCYGYYVPIDFQNVSLPDRFLDYMGSSINFCNELKDIAGKLKLDLSSYTPDLELLYEQRFKELDNDLLEFEKMLLLFLYNMTLGSINYDLIIQIT